MGRRTKTEERIFFLLQLGDEKGHVITFEDISPHLPRGKWRRYKKRRLRDIELVAVHHGAAPGGGREKFFAYARYHINHYGWPGIGYHFGVDKDGTVYLLQPIKKIVWHVGRGNRDAIGIVLAGNYDMEKPPEAQIRACVRLCAALCLALDLPYPSVKGHREFPYYGWKSCPGRNVSMTDIRNQLRAEIPKLKELEKAALELEEERRRLPAVQAVFPVYLDNKLISKGYLLDSTTNVPVRAVAEALGLTVEWKGKKEGVFLYSPKREEEKTSETKPERGE